MSAIDDLFEKLRPTGAKALMPFVTAGDPDLAFTEAVLHEMVRRGAHLCELGIPYSDPIADGPVIQASYTRALAKRIRVSDILRMVAQTSRSLAAPLVTMVSYAILHRYGQERYLDQARAAGARGAIVPDLPMEESAGLAALCRSRDFSLVQLVTPTTPRERALRIAATSSGFLYYVSVTGITGEREIVPQSLIDEVGWLREQIELPIAIGFGISRPEHVRALAGVADGLIVGSAIVRRMAQAGERPREVVVSEIGDFVAQLVAALPSAPAKSSGAGAG